MSHSHSEKCFLLIQLLFKHIFKSAAISKVSDRSCPQELAFLGKNSARQLEGTSWWSQPREEVSEWEF
jgi:hypothetical protein